MHVGCVEVVFFVPGRRRQDDVGVHAGGRHPEIEGHQEVELSLWCVVVPDDLLGFLTAVLAKILALDAMGGAEQMLEKIFMPLARRAQKV